MLLLLTDIMRVLRPFAPGFSERGWDWVQVLLVGALLAPGQRTVTSVLRVRGWSQAAQFQNQHRVRNRATWSRRALSRMLLHLLVRALVSDDAPVLVGIDEPIERRRGTNIVPTGIYRDPVRSRAAHLVKTSGLRWISMQLVVDLPWARRGWAWPFLTVLAPSERYHPARGQRYKSRTDWGRQLSLHRRRWLRSRQLVIVADSTYAVLELLARCSRLPAPLVRITRLRLDAARYEPAPPRSAPTRGRPRRKGQPHATLAQRLTTPATAWQTLTVQWYGHSTPRIESATDTAVWYHSGMTPVAMRWVLIRDPEKQFVPPAVLCTQLAVPAQQMVAWCVLRWQLAGTFQAVRTHLGVEPQRQWSAWAIRRTPPALLGLCSLVTLLAHHLLQGQALCVRQTAWQEQPVPTFAATGALVRHQLWPVTITQLSPTKPEVVEIPRAWFERLTNPLAFAA